MFSDWLKTLAHYLIPKLPLTLFAGYLANVTQPKIKNYLISRFVEKYQVDMKEALIENPLLYQHFNDFFIRHLKPECRPLAQADVVSPVDGCISEIGVIQKGQLMQAKGRYYSVKELLDCDQGLAQQFEQGHFATLYLSPKDYHRVHMPITGILKSMNYLPGTLFSVQPLTARTVSKLFARNERLVVFFETSLGLMAMVLVGATIVGSIGTSWDGEIKRAKKSNSLDYSHQNINLAQGDEMGYFKLGSTVILLFAEQTGLSWNADLKAGTPIRFGQSMGNTTLDSNRIAVKLSDKKLRSE